MLDHLSKTPLIDISQVLRPAIPGAGNGLRNQPAANPANRSAVQKAAERSGIMAEDAQSIPLIPDP